MIPQMVHEPHPRTDAFPENKTTIPPSYTQSTQKYKPNREYLMAIASGLMMITSMGIFGYHVITSQKISNLNTYVTYGLMLGGLPLFVTSTERIIQSRRSRLETIMPEHEINCGGGG